MVEFDFIEWDDEADPVGNVRHIAEHDITPEEVEDVLYGSGSDGVSRTTGRPIRFGRTSAGRDIVVIYEAEQDGGITVIRPITAYEHGEE